MASHKPKDHRDIVGTGNQDDILRAKDLHIGIDIIRVNITIGYDQHIDINGLKATMIIIENGLADIGKNGWHGPDIGKEETFAVP